VVFRQRETVTGDVELVGTPLERRNRSGAEQRTPFSFAGVDPDTGPPRPKESLPIRLPSSEHTRREPVGDNRSSVCIRWVLYGGAHVHDFLLCVVVETLCRLRSLRKLGSPTPDSVSPAPPRGSAHRRGLEGSAARHMVASISASPAPALCLAVGGSRVDMEQRNLL